MARFVAALVLFASVPSRAEPPVNAPPDGFVALFNGRDFEGWRGFAPDASPYKIEAMSPQQREAWQARADRDLHKHWRVENGELVNDGRPPYLATVKDYSDFELLVEWRIAPGADSGIYLRGTPQVQIWDTTEAGGKRLLGAKHGSGSLWNNRNTTNRALVHADRPPGEWNAFRILMRGDRVAVELNGRLVVDDLPLENYWSRDKPLPRRGPIQLQTHGGEIRWRNIFLRESPENKGQ
jgi:hypothetical protein